MSNTNWKEIVAETPKDAMGQDFADMFGSWVEGINISQWIDGDDVMDFEHFRRLISGLYSGRLDLAIEHNTFFAKQQLQYGDDIGIARMNGKGYAPSYSFALKKAEGRTQRLLDWTLKTWYVDHRLPDLTKMRYWDTNFAEYPTLPGGPYEPNDGMLTWEYQYTPVFEAKKGGALKMRRVLFHGNARDTSEMVFLFEHVRGVWVPLMLREAFGWYQKAVLEGNRSALAAFEWVYVWTNPFGRAAASTMDAMSLVVQKLHGWKHREGYYHQDCEALLLPFDEYVEKRANDLTFGFKPLFNMNVDIDGRV